MSTFLIIPQIKVPGGQVESKLFRTLYYDLGIPKNICLEVYFNLRKPSFISTYGNWPAARLDLINRKYNSLEEAKKSYNVTIDTDEYCEPTINTIRDILSEYSKYIQPNKTQVKVDISTNNFQMLPQE